MKNNLQHTKKKLTIIFTILVFLIVMILEVVFFSFKYQNDLRRDKSWFVLTTSGIIENLSKKEVLIQWFNKRDLQQKLFKRGEKWPQNNIGPEKFVSFIILNSQNELVFENIVQRFNFQNLDLHLDKSFYLTDEALVRTHGLRGYYENHHVIFFRKMKYPASQYREDLLFFFLITLLWSILFYYVGYRFVSKNLEPVEENLDDMRNFIHNAGHELKTPLSVIHGNLQLLNAWKKLDTKLTKESINEIERLSKLIEWLIDLSDIHSNEQKENCRLSDEIKLAISDFSHEAKAKKLSINFESKSEVTQNINREYFYILFSNLLGNAIKYSEKWGKIDIVLDRWCLTIEDYGKWIWKKHIEKIFDRFYQGSSARWTNWFGIWLSLVKKIADIYKWKVSVESEKWEGSKFTVKF